MKISFKGSYFLIISNSLVSRIGRIMGFKDEAMGLVIFPCFIVLRNLTHPMTKSWINHERIHIRQLISTLGLIWIYSQIEYIYARLVLKYSHFEAYQFETIEQEAYLNQTNLDYIQESSPFSFLKHIKRKARFKIDEQYHVSNINYN